MTETNFCYFKVHLAYHVTKRNKVVLGVLQELPAVVMGSEFMLFNYLLEIRL
jgi:hypothetical protein